MNYLGCCGPDSSFFVAVLSQFIGATNYVMFPGHPTPQAVYYKGIETITTLIGDYSNVRTDTVVQPDYLFRIPPFGVTGGTGQSGSSSSVLAIPDPGGQFGPTLAAIIGSANPVTSYPSPASRLREWIGTPFGSATILETLKPPVDIVGRRSLAKSICDTLEFPTVWTPLPNGSPSFAAEYWMTGTGVELSGPVFTSQVGISYAFNRQATYGGLSVFIPPSRIVGSFATGTITAQKSRTTFLDAKCEWNVRQDFGDGSPQFPTQPLVETPVVVFGEVFCGAGLITLPPITTGLENRWRVVSLRTGVLPSITPGFCFNPL